MAKQFMTAALRGTEETRRNIQRHAADVDAKMVRFEVKWLRLFTRWSQRKLTYNRLDGQTGGRDTGNLAKSMTHQLMLKKKGFIKGGWGPGEKHGPFVEFGTREHFLYFAFHPWIERWARRHGLPVEKTWRMKVGGPRSKKRSYLRSVKKEKEEKARKAFIKEFAV